MKCLALKNKINFAYNFAHIEQKYLNSTHQLTLK